MQSRHLQQIAMSLAMTACLAGMAQAQPTRTNRKFQIVEATIADIHKAIKSKQLTATQLVNMYLARIKAYNGTCVDDAESPARRAQEAGFRRSQSLQHDGLGRQRPENA